MLLSIITSCLFSSLLQISIVLVLFHFEMRSTTAYAWRRTYLGLKNPFSVSTKRALVASASSATSPSLNLNLDLPTNEKSDQLLRIRHSSAHVMAMAVQRLFPEIKVTIGPWIDNG